MPTACTRQATRAVSKRAESTYGAGLRANARVIKRCRRAYTKKANRTAQKQATWRSKSICKVTSKEARAAQKKIKRKSSMATNFVRVSFHPMMTVLLCRKFNLKYQQYYLSSNLAKHISLLIAQKVLLGTESQEKQSTLPRLHHKCAGVGQDD